MAHEAVRGFSPDGFFVFQGLAAPEADAIFSYNGPEAVLIDHTGNIPSSWSLNSLLLVGERPLSSLSLHTANGGALWYSKLFSHPTRWYAA